MIGEKAFRRKGLASNALRLTHGFIRDSMKKQLIQAKINKENTPSIEFFQKFGVRPSEGYGTTELSPVAAVNIPDHRTVDSHQIGSKLGTVGRPLPGVAALTQ